MRRRPPGRLAGALIVLCICVATPGVALAQGQSAEYRGTLRVVKHDISPPLRDIPPLPLPFNLDNWGGSIIDPPGTEGQPQYGRQTPDAAMQSIGPSQDIPGPANSFTAITNEAGFAPPDPVGDIGPDHYVTMSNLHFVVHDREGNSLEGPHPNNMLWSGFGGECETQNAGDPIVLYDQFADRWLLTQFTSDADSEGEYYNCVAVSTSPDPAGSYHLYQIANGGLFPDYPKYGVGEDAYFISTRDFNGSYEGVGAYALNRQDFINGTYGDNSVIGFFVDRNDVGRENVGDGLLPMDIDGFDMPPAGSPHYYIGSMDDGWTYGADQDALTVWEFVVDFDTSANSSFTLVATIEMSPYDTIFPCVNGAGSRTCIPQPDTSNRLDHQGYRQRPLHRAAYRNFGTHESIVTLQSVEADPGIAGMRWWEIRDFATTPAIHQEGTFAPGNEDGIHRWFGSIAQDSAGNMALGYSASNETTYPSIWYSGRLASDPPGTMPQGEGSIVNGTGSQTGGGNRWGDYSSMNVDPTDDCTFWYVNEWVPTTSPRGWVLQVGSFRFEECGDPGFALSVSSSITADVCTGDEADYGLNIGSIADFDMPVTLSATGNPADTSATFDPNPVAALPGTSTLTIGNTGGVSAGDYNIEITGMADGADNRTADVQLTVWDAVPGTPDLTSPADTATDQPLNPTFEWTGTYFEEFMIEIATDPGFTNIVASETTTETSFTPIAPLPSSTTHYWRVRGINPCGPGADSPVFTFTTEALAGDCPAGHAEVDVHVFDFETGDQGWTSGANVGSNTWALSGVNPNSGAQHWHVDDVASESDQFLASPAMAIPSDLNDLTFRFFDFQNFEAPPGPDECWDGGVLEVSTNGGTDFVEVVNADLLTNPYDGVLRNTTSNPLGGRDAWCDTAQPYTDSRVDISDLAGEGDVVFRFRIGTDTAFGAPGWDIDDVKVVGCTSVPIFQEGFESPDP